MTKFKAYIIQDDYEGRSLIIFAKHRATAQAEGANEMNYQFNEVFCRRAKEFDKFYPKVPISKLIEQGWWFTCFCDRQVDAEDIIKIDDEKEIVYCNNCITEDKNRG